MIGSGLGLLAVACVLLLLLRLVSLYKVASASVDCGMLRQVAELASLAEHCHAREGQFQSGSTGGE